MTDKRCQKRATAGTTSDAVLCAASVAIRWITEALWGFHPPQSSTASGINSSGERSLKRAHFCSFAAKAPSAAAPALEAPADKYLGCVGKTVVTSSKQSWEGFQFEIRMSPGRWLPIENSPPTSVATLCEPNANCAWWAMVSRNVLLFLAKISKNVNT